MTTHVATMTGFDRNKGFGFAVLEVPRPDGRDILCHVTKFGYLVSSESEPNKRLFQSFNLPRDFTLPDGIRVEIVLEEGPRGPIAKRWVLVDDSILDPIIGSD